MTQPPPPFLPSFNLFGSTIQEEDRDIFAGHVFLQTGEAEYPGRRIGTASLSLPRFPVIEKTKRGRPSKTPDYITLLAHCEMVEKLAPEASVAEIRRNALQVMFSSKSTRSQAISCGLVDLLENIT